MPSPRDLDPKFRTVEAPEETKEDKPLESPTGTPTPGGQVDAVDATVDPDEETYIVYKHPDGDVRMPMSEWADYQKENKL